jgi:hypothetical protein
MRALLKTALLSLGLAAIFLLGGAGKADAHSWDAVEADALDGSTAIQAGTCGNAVGVLGHAEASCEGSQDARATDEDGADDGWIDADVGDTTVVQGTVCGNAVGVLGHAEASCEGSQDARATDEDGADDGWIDADVGDTTVVQGTVCGNAVGVLGHAEASCEGSQDARAGSRDGDADTPIDIDVLRLALVVEAGACGNAVGALGEAEASCEGSQNAPATAGEESDDDRSDASVRGTGAVRVSACGNAVGAVGDAAASCEGSQASPGDRSPDAVPPATAGAGDGVLPSIVPTGVLGSGGVRTSLGPLAATGMSFGSSPLALVLFMVGIASLWAGRRTEGGDTQQ